MRTILIESELRLLNMMAHRNNNLPDNVGWAQWSFKDLCYRCHICNGKINGTFSDINKHGQEHLKSSNLLSFI